MKYTTALALVFLLIAVVSAMPAQPRMDPNEDDERRFDGIFQYNIYMSYELTVC